MSHINRLKGYAQHTVCPGVDFKCSICGQLLNNSEAGVRSHLRSHAKKGELKRSQVAKEALLILGREWVDW